MKRRSIINILLALGCVAAVPAQAQPEPRLANDRKVRVFAPAAGAEVRGPVVTFQGRAETASVRIHVYRRSDDQRMANQSVRVDDQKNWSARVPLARGNYRADVAAERKDGRLVEHDKFNFRVVGDTGGGGGGADGAAINLAHHHITAQIRRDYGNTTTVQYRINNVSAGNIFGRRTVSGDGRLIQSPSDYIMPFDYQATVDTRNNRVVSGSYTPRGGSQPGGGGNLTVTSPTQGEVFRGPRVTFSGRTNASDVQVQVYRNNQRVLNTTVAVRSGRFDFNHSFTRLGNYRAEFEARRGNSVLSETRVNFRLERFLPEPRTR